MLPRKRGQTAFLGQSHLNKSEVAANGADVLLRHADRCRGVYPFLFCVFKPINNN